MKPRGRGLVFARAVCGGGGATIGHRRSLSDALRFAGHEGGASRKRRPCPLFLRFGHWAFAVRSLGVLLPFGAIGRRSWIRSWIVGLTRSRGTIPERDRRALALLCRVPGSERFFGARLPVHAWRGSEFDRAAFSVLFGRSRFKPAKVATKRAGRMGSQRGAHGAGLGRSRRECKRLFDLFKAVLRPARAVACESAALGCLPSRWEEITGSAPRSRRRAIVERAQSVARRMPCGRFAQRHAFFLLFFSDWRA